MNIQFKFILLLLFELICSCSNNPNIQKVKDSSPLLHCEKVFADNSDAIDERNEIILQTGVIDTTDEQPPIKIAIINIDYKEVILTLKKSYAEKDISVEIYVGDNYNLTLSYKIQVNENGTSLFIGKFVIENKKCKKEFNIEGRYCNL
jgi:hypothetical protein